MEWALFLQPRSPHGAVWLGDVRASVADCHQQERQEYRSAAGRHWWVHWYCPAWSWPVWRSMPTSTRWFSRRRCSSSADWTPGTRVLAVRRRCDSRVRLRADTASVDRAPTRCLPPPTTAGRSAVRATNTTAPTSPETRSVKLQYIRRRKSAAWRQNNDKTGTKTRIKPCVLPGKHKPTCWRFWSHYITSSSAMTETAGARRF